MTYHCKTGMEWEWTQDAQEWDHKVRLNLYDDKSNGIKPWLSIPHNQKIKWARNWEMQAKPNVICPKRVCAYRQQMRRRMQRTITWWNTINISIKKSAYNEKKISNPRIKIQFSAMKISQRNRTTHAQNILYYSLISRKLKWL